MVAVRPYACEGIRSRPSAQHSSSPSERSNHSALSNFLIRYNTRGENLLVRLWLLGLETWDLKFVLYISYNFIPCHLIYWLLNITKKYTRLRVSSQFNSTSSAHRDASLRSPTPQNLLLLPSFRLFPIIYHPIFDTIFPEQLEWLEFCQFQNITPLNALTVVSRLYLCYSLFITDTNLQSISRDTSPALMRVPSSFSPRRSPAPGPPDFRGSFKPES